MTASPEIGGAIWLVIFVLCGLIFWRLKARRRHIGSGAAGTVYDMLHEEKRNAVEIIVQDKAAARDFEHADDKDQDDHVRSHRDTETQRHRVRP